MNISLIVPTYRRTKDLQRCLEAIKRQTKPVHQLLVTIRDTDQETWDFFETYDPGSLPLELLKVSRTGVIAALNTALAAATGDILTATDDDAEAYPDWLEQIEKHFADDPAVGAVGGKDVLYENGVLKDGEAPIVGVLQWFGRPIGNHSQGIGPAREVDLLKGVNMSFRMAALGELTFDERMLGTGAQVHYEMSICLSLKRAGWKVIYDPNVLVNHFRAERFDEDQRYIFNPVANYNQVYNETIVLLDHFKGVQKIVFVLWAIFIGTRAARGLLQMIRFVPKEGLISLRRWWAAMRGRFNAGLFLASGSEEARTLQANLRLEL